MQPEGTHPMRNETTEALCRLVTMFVAAIEREGTTIPEQLVGQIATDPLKACEGLNELALTCGAVDDELDAALAAIYESMNASDARGVVDDHTRERVLRAFDEAHREPELEPKHEPEPAEPAASAQEGEQPSEPAHKSRRRSHRQRGEEAAREAAEQATAEPERAPQPKPEKPEAPKAPAHEEGPQETQPEPGQQPAAKKEAPEPKPEAQTEDRDAKAKPESVPAPKPAPAAASGDVLTVDQAIAVLGVSRPTVYKLIESGRLPAYKKGRSWQISAEAVAARANK